MLSLAVFLPIVCGLLLLLLGCFMDMAPLITIMTPILVPVVTNPAIGMDPVHFGVVLIFNLAVGLCTPPVGSALFVGCAIGKTPIERTAKNMLPLYATMVIVLLLVTYVPDISLLLPRLLADDPITAEDIARLGEGGLCLGCAECHWPNCGFGHC